MASGAGSNGRVEVPALILWRAIFGESEGQMGLFSGRREEGMTALQDTRSHYLYYPLGVERALAWCLDESRVGREVYFCAHLLTKPQRRRNNAREVRALWADGDGAAIPEGVPEPSVTVQSSPGRTQLYWMLSRPIEPKVAERLNKRLAIATGADMSGYDLTQLLRVPGTLNRKYPGNPEVVIVEETGEVHDPEALDRDLPALPVPEPSVEEYTGPSEVGFELEDWLERHAEAESALLGQRDDDAARVKYAVVCPWVEEHTGEDVSGTFVGQYPNGALFFRCHHEHCEGRSWQEYRDFYDPTPENTRVALIDDLDNWNLASERK